MTGLCCNVVPSCWTLLNNLNYSARAKSVPIIRELQPSLELLNQSWLLEAAAVELRAEGLGVGRHLPAEQHAARDVPDLVEGDAALVALRLAASELREPPGPGRIRGQDSAEGGGGWLREKSRKPGR